MRGGPAALPAAGHRPPPAPRCWRPHPATPPAACPARSATNYREFEAELRERGVPERRIWEELERLNVGRLRIASKGIERDAAGELTAVAEERQLAEGMFMAGEVAVLRSATTTIGALHGSVTTRRGRLPRRARGSAPRTPRDGHGRGARGARAAGRRRRRHGLHVPAGPRPRRLLGEHPRRPRRASARCPPTAGTPPCTTRAGRRTGATPSKWGGFLPRIPFDPLRYGIPPTSLGSIEPVQLLALEAARRALEDAGYGERGRAFDRSRTSVVFGAEAGSDLSNADHAARRTALLLRARCRQGWTSNCPRLTEDSFPGMLANVISGRIANRLDLGGANYTVDAACASSLAAVDVACKELVGGTSDVVLCGGADLHNGINDYVLFSSVHALSPTGRSPRLRQLGGRHRARRGRRLRRTQAARGRRARRRPDLRRDQGSRQLQRRPLARADGAPARGPARRAGAGLPQRRGLARRGRPGRGARHRDRGRGPHRTDHPQRGVHRGRGQGGRLRARFGQVADRAHQVRRRTRRADQDRARPVHRGQAAHPAHEAAEPRLAGGAAARSSSTRRPGPGPPRPRNGSPGSARSASAAPTSMWCSSAHDGRRTARARPGQPGPPSCSPSAARIRRRPGEPSRTCSTAPPRPSGRPVAPARPRARPRAAPPDARATSRSRSRSRRRRRRRADSARSAQLRRAHAGEAPAAGHGPASRAGHRPSGRQVQSRRPARPTARSRSSSPGRAASGPGCSRTCSSPSPNSSDYLRTRPRPRRRPLYPPAAFDDGRAGPPADRDHRHPGRPAGAGHRRTRRPRTCSPRPAYGPTWPPGTATANSSPSARPAPSTRRRSC